MPHFEFGDSGGLGGPYKLGGPKGCTMYVIDYINVYRCDFNVSFILIFQRPPSSSLSAYGLGNDEARSPSSGGGTPGLLSHQPGSHISGDNISEAGKTPLWIFQSYLNSIESITQMLTFILD